MSTTQRDHTDLIRRANDGLNRHSESAFRRGHADDLVAYRFTATGTHEGPFRGVEATGRPMEVTGQAMARVADGEIAEVWLQYDVAGMLRQLGATPAP